MLVESLVYIFLFQYVFQLGTLYIPPLNPEELQCQKSTSSEKVDSPGSSGSPLDTLKKAPTPAWLAGRGQQKVPEVPAWARSPPESAAASVPSTPVTPQTAQNPSVGSRVIPIHIEKFTDVIDNSVYQQQQAQYQQQQEQYLQQQQQYQQQQQQYRQQIQQQQQRQQIQQQQQHIVRVIPIQIEGRSNAGPPSPLSNL